MDGKFFKRLISFVTLVAFVFTSVASSYAQSIVPLPVPGTMVQTSTAFVPATLKGMKVYPKEPLRFDFVVDTGNSTLIGEALKPEVTKIVRYFLASLTTPEKDLWVNLSPYEGDRIIPDAFGQTEMGRDLLAEDYILKQLTSSLMYPESALGKEIWKKIYAAAFQKYGTTDVPIDTFNKVWITPDEATVYVNGNTAVIKSSHLKVLLESDYLAAQKAQDTGHKAQEETCVGAPCPVPGTSSSQDIAKQVIREVVLPVIEKEVNEGQNFALLRQIYHAMVLATWFKRNLKESLVGRVYTDKNKVKGIDLAEKGAKEEIWRQYVEAFKKGAFNYIKEEADEITGDVIPRKYFSGGFKANEKVMKQIPASNETMSAEFNPASDYVAGVRLNNAANPAMKTGEAEGAMAVGERGNLIRRIASQMHEAWKRNFSAEKGAGVPNWKNVNDEESVLWFMRIMRSPSFKAVLMDDTGTIRFTEEGKMQVDIANRRFEQLGKTRQEENVSAGYDGLDLLKEAFKRGFTLNELQSAFDQLMLILQDNALLPNMEFTAAERFLYDSADKIHKSWLSRNSSWTPEAQQKSFDQLDAFNQRLDLNIIKVALGILKQQGWVLRNVEEHSQELVMAIAAYFHAQWAEDFKIKNGKLTNRWKDVDLSKDRDLLILLRQHSVLFGDLMDAEGVVRLSADGRVQINIAGLKFDQMDEGGRRENLAGADDGIRIVEGLTEEATRNVLDAYLALGPDEHLDESWAGDNEARKFLLKGGEAIHHAWCVRNNKAISRFSSLSPYYQRQNLNILKIVSEKNALNRGEGQETLRQEIAAAIHDQWQADFLDQWQKDPLNKSKNPARWRDVNGGDDLIWLNKILNRPQFSVGLMNRDGTVRLTKEGKFQIDIAGLEFEDLSADAQKLNLAGAEDGFNGLRKALKERGLSEAELERALEKAIGLLRSGARVTEEFLGENSVLAEIGGDIHRSWSERKGRKWEGSFLGLSAEDQLGSLMVLEAALKTNQRLKRAEGNVVIAIDVLIRAAAKELHNQWRGLLREKKGPDAQKWVAANMDNPEDRNRVLALLFGPQFVGELKGEGWAVKLAQTATVSQTREVNIANLEFDDLHQTARDKNIKGAEDGLKMVREAYQSGRSEHELEQAFSEAYGLLDQKKALDSSFANGDEARKLCLRAINYIQEQWAIRKGNGEKVHSYEEMDADEQKQNLNIFRIVFERNKLLKSADHSITTDEETLKIEAAKEMHHQWRMNLKDKEGQASARWVDVAINENFRLLIRLLEDPQLMGQLMSEKGEAQLATNGQIQIDITKLTNDELSKTSREQNEASARDALSILERAKEKNVSLSDLERSINEAQHRLEGKVKLDDGFKDGDRSHEFVLEAVAELDREWLKRQGSTVREKGTGHPSDSDIIYGQKINLNILAIALKEFGRVQLGEIGPMTKFDVNEPAMKTARFNTLAWKPDEIEKKLSSGAIEGGERINKGTMGALHGTIDGMPVVVKPDTSGVRQFSGAEVAAYRLSKLLGLDIVPPTILATYEGQDASIQMSVAGEKEYFDPRKTEAQFIDDFERNDMLRYVAQPFWFLLGDPDKGLLVDKKQGRSRIKNFWFRPDGKLVSVDHGGAFLTAANPKQYNDGKTIPWNITPSPEFLAALEGLEARLGEPLDPNKVPLKLCDNNGQPLIFPEKWNAVLERRAVILAHARGEYQPAMEQAAQKGFKAFQEMVDRVMELPENFGGREWVAEDSSLLLVYTGVVAEFGSTSGTVLPWFDYQAKDMVQKMEKDPNFRVIDRGGYGYSIINVEAARRVMAANPDLFPELFPESNSQPTSEQIQEWLTHNQQKWVDGRDENAIKRQGLLSGAPRQAAEKFVQAQQAFNKLMKEVERSIDKEREDLLLSLTDVSSRRTEGEQEALSARIDKAFPGILTTNEISILVARHLCGNPLEGTGNFTFMGFSKEDDAWHDRLQQIYQDALAITASDKRIQEITAKARERKADVDKIVKFLEDNGIEKMDLVEIKGPGKDGKEYNYTGILDYFSPASIKEYRRVMSVHLRKEDFEDQGDPYNNARIDMRVFDEDPRRFQIRKLSQEEINGRGKFRKEDWDRLCLHGTTAAVLLSAITETNSQLRNSEDLDGVFSGETMGMRQLNRKSVSTVNLGKSSSNLQELWERYAEVPTQYDMTLEKVRVLRVWVAQERQKALLTGKREAAREAEQQGSILQKAEGKILSLQAGGKWKAYQDFSKIPVFFVGEGKWGTRVSSDTGIGDSKEIGYKRVNIRLVAVDKKDFETVAQLLRENNVQDIALVTKDKLEALIREYAGQYGPVSNPDSKLVNLLENPVVMRELGETVQEGQGNSPEPAMTVEEIHKKSMETIVLFRKVPAPKDGVVRGAENAGAWWSTSPFYMGDINGPGVFMLQISREEMAGMKARGLIQDRSLDSQYENVVLLEGAREVLASRVVDLTKDEIKVKRLKEMINGLIARAKASVLPGVSRAPGGRNLLPSMKIAEDLGSESIFHSNDPKYFWWVERLLRAEQGLPTVDPVMVSKVADVLTKGGIDLNSKDLKLSETGGKVDFGAAVDPAMLAKGIDGFIPVVFSITPMTDPQAFFATAQGGTP